MNERMNEIANDLNKLLSEVKAKPVVVREHKAPETPKVNTAKLASELTALVFKTAPVGTDPSVVAEALLQASMIKAAEYKISTKEVLESSIDYCIKMIESAQAKIDLVE